MLQPLTTSEMQAFEKFACDNFDITVDDMMQSAGKAIFDLVVNEIKPKRVLVVAGKGNNGGDALVAVRLLKEEGVGVEILSPYSDDDSEGAIGQSRLRDIEFDLIIDALFGFSLKGNPRPPADEIINQINESGILVLSVDVPSGLDAQTGQVMNPTVKATYTIALGMPKIGLEEHKEYVGKLYLGSLGIPEKAYQELGYYTPIFLGKTYIPLD